MSLECASAHQKTKRLRRALYTRSIELPVSPKFKSQADGVDFDRLPPNRLVAPLVKFTVVRTTERQDERSLTRRPKAAKRRCASRAAAGIA